MKRIMLIMVVLAFTGFGAYGEEKAAPTTNDTNAPQAQPAAKVATKGSIAGRPRYSKLKADCIESNPDLKDIPRGVAGKEKRKELSKCIREKRKEALEALKK